MLCSLADPGVDSPGRMANDRAMKITLVSLAFALVLALGAPAFAQAPVVV